MKHTIKIFATFIVVFAFILTSCQEKKESPLLNEQLSLDNLPELIEKIKNDEYFTREEINLLNSSLQSNMNRLDSLEGKTLKQIIETQERNLREISFNTLVGTSIGLNVASRYNGFVPSDKDSGIAAFQILVLNKSKKDLKRVKGRLIFTTNRRQNVASFNINLNVNIPAGKQTLVLAKTNQMPQTKNDLKNLRKILQNAPQNSMFAQWQVLEIEFADGKVISMLNKKNEATAEKQ